MYLIPLPEPIPVETFVFPPDCNDDLEYAAIKQEREFQEVYKVLPYPFDVELGYKWEIRCAEDVDGTASGEGVPMLMARCVYYSDADKDYKVGNYIDGTLIFGQQVAANEIINDPFRLLTKGRVYVSRGLFEDEDPNSIVRPSPFDLKAHKIHPLDLRVSDVLKLIVYLQWEGAKKRYGEYAKNEFDRLRITAIRRSVGIDGIVRFFPELQVPNIRHPHWGLCDWSIPKADTLKDFEVLDRGVASG